MGFLGRCRFCTSRAKKRFWGHIPPAGHAAKFNAFFAETGWSL